MEHNVSSAFSQSENEKAFIYHLHTFLIKIQPEHVHYRG